MRSHAYIQDFQEFSRRVDCVSMHGRARAMAHVQNMHANVRARPAKEDFPIATNLPRERNLEGGAGYTYRSPNSRSLLESNCDEISACNVSSPLDIINKVLVNVMKIFPPDLKEKCIILLMGA